MAAEQLPRLFLRGGPWCQGAGSTYLHQTSSFTMLFCAIAAKRIRMSQRYPLDWQVIFARGLGLDHWQNAILWPGSIRQRGSN